MKWPRHREPRIWALLDDRPGHRTQVLGLADRLGWPVEAKQLSFNRLNKLFNPLLGARLHSVDTEKSDALAPPFPDVVISMGRRCVPVARWIGRASDGRAKLVHIGRKGVTAADEFSLLISCDHFNMPPHAHRLTVTLPLTQVSEERLSEAKTTWRPLLAERRRPHIVFLVGGGTALHVFPTDFAADVLSRAETATAAIGGSLSVVTSRRTPPAVIKAMQDAADHAAFELWSGDRTDNPYLGYLAWADGFIVTGESESMLAEVASTGKPLYIVGMPPKETAGLKRLKRGLNRRMTYIARETGALAWICRGLFNNGWMTPFRDLEKMHDLMYRADLARSFESELILTPPAANSTSDQIIEKLMELFAPTPSCPVQG